MHSIVSHLGNIDFVAGHPGEVRLFITAERQSKDMETPLLRPEKRGTLLL